MITDSQTNYLYLADTLQINYPNFYSEFEKSLKLNKIDYSLLQNTKDVWAVDFMPIQISKDKFVRFIYDPIYLQSFEALKLISDTDAICKSLNINTIKSEILLDGGNVVKCVDKVIITERVFKENKNLKRNKLIEELEILFETDKIFFIPSQPYDFTGHADGMVRFVDDNSIIINDFSNESKSFQASFEKAISNTGLYFEKIPCVPNWKIRYDSAKGIYINFLQMENIIFAPIFEIEEDEISIRKLEEVFKGSKIVPLNSNEIADDCGILNCISWNILK